VSESDPQVPTPDPDAPQTDAPAPEHDPDDPQAPGRLPRRGEGATEDAPSEGDGNDQAPEDAE